MLTLIFANGTLDQSAHLTTIIEQADLIIAADGGANHCAVLGIVPGILLGDLDSIDPIILATYRKEGVAIHQHPPRKDATDLELAIDLATQKGAQTIWLTGVLGGRWDMSLANIMLAANDKYKGQEIFVMDKDCSMQILHPGKTHKISGMHYQKVSLLPLKGDVHGVTLTGFEYPLSHQTIPFGATLGVSNILKKKAATVRHAQGILLCILFSE